jgi:hypothetical protein
MSPEGGGSNGGRERERGREGGGGGAMRWRKKVGCGGSEERRGQGRGFHEDTRCTRGVESIQNCAVGCDTRQSGERKYDVGGGRGRWAQ